MSGSELWAICVALGLGCLVLAAVVLRLRAQLVRLRHRLDQERYLQVLNTSHDAVVLVDGANVIRFANDAVGTLFGHVPESLVGSPLSVLQPERLRAAHVAGIARYVSSGVRKLDWRATCVPALHRDGHEIPVEISFAEITSNRERLFVAFMRDLSERQAAEEQRQLLEQRLLEARKLEAVGTLAGGIAHGINNALAVILGNLQLAEDAAGAEPELRRSHGEIHVAARRARALVHQVLLFSQQAKPTYQVCDMTDVVVGTVALLGGVLPDRIRVEVVSDEPVPAVMADPQQVELVLLSLATNAAEAIDSDAGRIDVRVDAITLTEVEAKSIPGLGAGRYVRIRFSDSGKGMDAETLRRIFEPFFTTGSEAEHAGIGLSVVHGIVKAHLGAVTAESTPGRGSCFTLYFPATGEGPALPAVQPEAPAAPAHILYVDDEESLADLMQRLLARRGYRVTAFTDPQEALACIESGDADFDFVLTDHNMPKMSGLDLARVLLRLQPTLPVAILSGYVNDGLRENAAEAGVREVFYKENLVQDLCDRIEQFVRERGAEPGTIGDSRAD